MIFSKAVEILMKQIWNKKNIAIIDWCSKFSPASIHHSISYKSLFNCNEINFLGASFRGFCNLCILLYSNAMYWLMIEHFCMQLLWYTLHIITDTWLARMIHSRFVNIFSVGKVLFAFMISKCYNFQMSWVCNTNSAFTCFALVFFCLF